MAGGLVAVLLLVAACGESAEPVTPAPPPAAAVARPAWDLPAAEPGPAERIAFYVERAASGDPEEEAWAARELARAGPPGETALRRALEAALGEHPARAEKLVAVYAERLPVDDATEVLLRAAGAEDGRVRLGAARALARSDDPAAVPALVDLAGDGITVVARTAIASLSRRGSVEGARAIRGRFPDGIGSAPEVRQAAVRFAGETLPLAEAKGFLGSVAAGADRGLAVTAAGTLAARGEAEGAKALAALLADARNEDARLDVLAAMAAAGMAEAVGPLREMAEGPDRELSVGATAALGAGGEGPAREALRDLAVGAARGEVRREARHELLRAGDPAGRELVLEMLRGPADSRKTAAALVSSARARALADDVAAALFRETEPGVRLALASALSSVGDAGAARPLVRVLAGEPEADPALAVTAHNAARALLRLPALDDAGREALVSATRAPGAGVRLNAARVLGGFGAGEDAVRALLADPSPAVRGAAAGAFARMPGAAVGPLRERFEAENDPDAARALLSAARMVYYRWPR